MEWVNKVNLPSFHLKTLLQFQACVLAREKQNILIDVTAMFTYSHANTPFYQSERAYYFSYFIIDSGLRMNILHRWRMPTFVE